MSAFLIRRFLRFVVVCDERPRIGEASERAEFADQGGGRLGADARDGLQQLGVGGPRPWLASSQVPGVRIRHPYLRESVMLEEVEQMPSVAPVGLRFPDDHGADFGRFAHEDGVTEPVHEAVKPLGVAGGFDADRDGRTECAVETFHRVPVVDEFLLQDFSCRRVENRDLLFSRVQITSDECHDHGLLFLRAVALWLSEGNSSARPFS